MFKEKYKKIYTIIISLIILFSATDVFAVCNQEGVDSVTGKICYIQLEPAAFANFETGTPSASPLADFLGQVFNFGIAAAVVLALIMIIWGGIIKMTTDSWENQNDANEKITNAVYGLGLALVSYLILYTINPCLVVFAGGSGCASPNTFLFPPQVTQNTSGAANISNTNLSAVNQLKNAGIAVVSSGSCTNPNIKTCTSLEGLPQSAITGLINAQKKCGSCITVTGGTETGHKSHGSGIATVDIAYNPAAVAALKQQIMYETKSGAGFSGPARRKTFTCEPPGGGSNSVPCGPGASVIHVQF